MDLLPHVAFAFVALSFAVRDIIWLRCLAMLASSVFVCYEGQQWMGGHEYRVPNVLWHTVFFCINAYQVWVLVYGEHHARFSDEELALYESTFRSLTRLEFEKLVRTGRWIDLESGGVLATQGEDLDRMLLVSSGTAAVEVDGTPIARVIPGEFIGEMSFVTGEPASATVTASEPMRCLAWAKGDLQSLLLRQPAMRVGISAAMGVDLSHKLARRARERPDGPQG